MKKSKKLIAMLLTLMMLLSILPVAAFADGDSINYIDKNGEEKTATATMLTEGSTSWSGWVYVTGNVTISQDVTLASDEVNLILADGASLTVLGSTAAKPAIIGGGKAFNIYAQTDKTGKLSVKGIDTGDNTAGYGVQADITVYSGIVDITGGNGLTAHSGQGRSGGHAIFGNSSPKSSLAVYGGKVTLTGGTGGNSTSDMTNPGTGGYGMSNATLDVYGGEVTVASGNSGNSVNTGKRGQSGVGIFGGDVSVSGSGKLTVIVGTGFSADGNFAIYNNVTLSGGELTVTGGDAAGDNKNGGIGIKGNLTATGGTATIQGGKGIGTSSGGKAVGGTVTAEGLNKSETAPVGTTGGTLIISSAPAHTHSLTKVETCSATCTTAGVNTAYYVCTGDNGCGKFFSDSEGKNEITAEALKTYIDPATGHDFTGDAASNGNGTHSFLCVNGCGAFGMGSGKNAVVGGSEACSGGKATCCELAYCDKCFDAYGEHDHDNHCGEAILDETTIVAATCVSEGYTGDKICSECGNVAEAGKVTELDPTNHCGEAILDETSVVAATCVSAGYTGDKICSECEAVVEEGKATELDPTNHCGEAILDETTVVAATCVSAGYTGDKCCSECGEVVEAGKATELLDHDYSGEVRANNDGTHSFKCKNGCNEYGGTVPCVDEKDGGDGYCDVCGAVMDPLAQDRADAIAKLEAIVNGNTNEKVQSMLAGYVAEINNASSLNEINRIVSNATSALQQQIEIANEGGLVKLIRTVVNLIDSNNQKTTSKVMNIVKPILKIFGIK